MQAELTSSLAFCPDHGRWPGVREGDGAGETPEQRLEGSGPFPTELGMMLPKAKGSQATFSSCHVSLLLLWPCGQPAPQSPGLARAPGPVLTERQEGRAWSGWHWDASCVLCRSYQDKPLHPGWLRKPLSAPPLGCLPVQAIRSALLLVSRRHSIPAGSRESSRRHVPGHGPISAAGSMTLRLLAAPELPGSAEDLCLWD